MTFFTFLTFFNDAEKQRKHILSNIYAWAVGDYCVSLKVLKSPHKEVYLFKLTIMRLSLSSSLSSAKYFHQCSMHTTTVA